MTPAKRWTFVIATLAMTASGAWLLATRRPAAEPMATLRDREARPDSLQRGSAVVVAGAEEAVGPGPIAVATSVETRAATERGSRISGRVVEAESGAPVTSFRFLVFDAIRGEERAPYLAWAASRPTIESADGAFETDDVPPGEHQLLVVSDDHWASEIGPLEIESGRSIGDIVVRLERSATIRGRVSVASTGASIAGASIELRAKSDTSAFLVSTTSSSADGTFELRGVAQGRFDLRIDHAEFVPEESAVFETSAGVTRELEFELERGGAIEGIAVGLDSRSIAYASVFANVESDFVHAIRSTTTDDRGHFRIAGLVPGACSVEVVQFGAEPESLYGRATVIAGETVSVDFAQWILRGRVLRSGVGVAGIRVVVTVRRGDSLSSQWPSPARTDEKGYFVVALAPPFELELTFQDDSGVGHVFSFEVSRQASVERDFVLPIGGTIRGRAVHASSRDPIGALDIEVDSVGGGSCRGSTVTDVSGDFCLSGLAPGPYRLSTSGKRPHENPPNDVAAAPLQRLVRIDDGSTETVELALEEGGSVTVDVALPENDRLGHVLLVPEQGFDESNYLQPKNVTTTGARFEHVPSGRWFAQARVESGDPATRTPFGTSAPFDVRTAEEVRTRVEVNPGIPLRVRVRGLETAGRKGVRFVSVRDEKGRWIARRGIDDPSGVEIRVVPGRLVVQVTYDGRAGKTEIDAKQLDGVVPTVDVDLVEPAPRR